MSRTIRKLARRLGPEVIEEICRQSIIAASTGRGRFVARAARIGSTVVEADVRYPTDLGPAADATDALARQGARVAHLAGGGAPRAADRSRAVNRRLRTLNRTLARRTGQGAAAALRLTGEAGTIVGRSIREGLRGATAPRARARGRGARAKPAAAARLEPDARPIRKGKLRQPTEFGYVLQLAALTESNPPRGPWPDPSGRHPDRRGRRVGPAAGHGRRGGPPRPSPGRGRPRRRLLPSGVAEHLPGVGDLHRGPSERGLRRTNRRLARYRVGCEGRISHLKRRCGLRRSRLRGHEGARTWVAWAILAYNLDTLAIRGS